MANICANYLQVVTKDTLENQVSLGMCMARFASHCAIVGAHPKQSRIQLPLQLSAKCLVISQLTISILGVLRRHHIPLETYPHIATATASQRGAKSAVAHKRAGWLHNPCHLGGPHRFRAGGKIKSGPQVDRLATQPLPPGGSPLLRSGGQNQEWPTSGRVAT